MSAQPLPTPDPIEFPSFASIAETLDRHLADSPCSGCRAGCDDCARQLEEPLASAEQLAALRARLTVADPLGHGPVPCTAPGDQARAHLHDARGAWLDVKNSLDEAADSAYALVTSLWFAAAAVNTGVQRALADRVIGLVLHRRETALSAS